MVAAAAQALSGARRLRLFLSTLKPGVHVPQAEPVAAFSSSVTSAKVAVNGVHLHYLRTGGGEHAVLLLPGMLGSGETDFGPQIENLNKKLFTVVAWDPRGYGHSRPPDRDYPVEFFERDAKDAVDLMKMLKFKKVSLLGWSDGGITALIAAARYPSYINKMVIWGANAYVTDQDEEIYRGIRDVSKWSERTREPLEALYGFDYLARTCEKWVDGIKQFKHLPDGNICRHLLPLVQCPTLIVHGEKDPLVPSFHADFIHKHVKGSRLKYVHIRGEPVIQNHKTAASAKPAVLVAHSIKWQRHIPCLCSPVSASQPGDAREPNKTCQQKFCSSIPFVFIWNRDL
ncbi:valacyclovir hydrolase isoform X1 [Globicephala melas]|uniref:valacyclovir hydrolase isoform X1 n=1 Tax=Globicephala melas TaxID=9731 RepID=UPI00122EFB79|nr:valacyclovir hydrolase isoform X1 [Globicephala melas]